jgi:hypothetical protein
LESGTEKPLIRLGVSTFISILNVLNSLRNQSGETGLTPRRPLCLIPSPSLQSTTTTGFLSHSTVDWVHVCLPRQSIRIPSRDLYSQLSALLPQPADAPHRSIVLASIRLVTRTITRLTIPQADASIPGMFSLGLCQHWAVAS